MSLENRKPKIELESQSAEYMAGLIEKKNTLRDASDELAYQIISAGLGGNKEDIETLKTQRKDLEAAREKVLIRIVRAEHGMEDAETLPEYSNN